MNFDLMIEKLGKIIEIEGQRPKSQKAADPGIEHAGSKIILPADPAPMGVLEAITTLFRYLEDEETEMSVFEEILAYPLDAAVALNKAMREIYGWASPTPTPTWWGEIPPDLVTVKTGPGPYDSVQVPFGQFKLPGIDKPIKVHAGRDGITGMPCLHIHGTVKKREKAFLVQLARRTRELVESESIYKGKALRLRADGEGNLMLGNGAGPEFINMEGRQDLILNPIERDQIQAALWTPIEFTDECVAHKIPLKRGILLEGTYGIGKTLTARETARICVENGWTFITVDDVRGLEEALQFARRFQPAVVFAEDIDRIMENRDQDGNDLLNTVDGVLSKDSKVITVLTTNHVDKINKAMLRPGRFDAVVRMKPPQAETVERLLRLYGRGLIPQQESLVHVGEVLAGHIPATIREVVERSKLSMIASQRDEVSEHDLLVAAEAMKGHLELLVEQGPKKTPEEELGDAMGKVVRKANGLDKLEKQVDSIVDAVMGN